MLEGQKNATPFFKPFEQAWHNQLVEWLRLDSYNKGMPPNMRLTFEREVHHEVEQWREELFEAENNV